LPQPPRLLDRLRMVLRVRQSAPRGRSIRQRTNRPTSCLSPRVGGRFSNQGRPEYRTLRTAQMIPDDTR
jgi:hypothetical protein